MSLPMAVLITRALTALCFLMDHFESCFYIVERLTCTTGSGVQLWGCICKAGGSIVYGGDAVMPNTKGL